MHDNSLQQLQSQQFQNLTVCVCVIRLLSLISLAALEFRKSGVRRTFKKHKKVHNIYQLNAL